MNTPVQSRQNPAKVVAAVVLTLLFSFAFFWAAAPAHADDETWFNEFHVEAELGEDGRMSVTTHVEYDFQNMESRGIYLNFVTRQDIEGDPDHQRVYDFSGFSATSSTGAATDINVERTSNAVGVYIGDPDKQNLTGVHSYEISYTVEGIPNAGAGENGEDEIYWNIIGSGFAEPIKDFRMSLSTPAEPTNTACWYGEVGSRSECEHGGADSSVEFAQTNIEPGQGVTIAAEYPAGSFEEEWTIIKPKPRPSSSERGLDRKTLALGAAGVVALLGGGALYSRRNKKDEVYVGLPPGLEPPAGQKAEVALVRPATDYPVQFHPPTGQIPAEIGALVSEKADPNYLAATIVDLAVRGYLTIDTEEKKGWKVFRTEQAPQGLTTHEQNVLDALFGDGNDEVSLDDLDTDAETALRHEVLDMGERLKDRGWFSGRLRSHRPRSSGPRMLMFWVIIILVGVSNGMLGRVNLLPLIVISVFVLFFFFTKSKRARRTAKGSAVYAQAMGFRKFLETADARQLRFEAGEDIFSRYLPYAMVFGVVNRWVELFRTLPPEVSAHLPAATWIRGPHTYQTLPEQLSTMDMPATLMSGQASTAIAGQTRSTSGSSGGSAFSGSSSGGGGSSGGGVSGGGGGRW